MQGQFISCPAEKLIQTTYDINSTKTLTPYWVKTEYLVQELKAIESKIFDYLLSTCFFSNSKYTFLKNNF